MDWFLYDKDLRHERVKYQFSHHEEISEMKPAVVRCLIDHCYSIFWSHYVCWSSYYKCYLRFYQILGTIKYCWL